MPFIEAPTTFYLGRRYDPEQQRLHEDVVYYDSRDLTTHAVVLGMTGSGKTGLCVTLLEEAILDNIPAIIIDPKGDITNLLLTFPDMRPQDFQPWINPDDAQRAGLDLTAYSADVAQQWKDGLTSWGIVPDRVRWLKAAAQYSIYTPGSDAGLPISILASLRAPRYSWEGNEEELRERINGITTALLALVGMDAQPLKDREHVLIANIFEYNWRQNVDLTLEDIILQVQKPPFNKLGVFPIDKYMSEKARVKLAMDLNSIIASPSFQSWLQGQPLDIHHLFYQPNGRPRVSIFYLAHLSEAERMFITTLLLETMLGWMRTLSGTTSLRALLYIDEMFGYFPPYPRNPPTKDPLLRLLKQARAFGVGLILATQNPGDLDYKGLSNAGTWFIGRLQSENDKARVMDGLESLASTSQSMDLKDVEALIADIAPRVFLMRNVHDDESPLLVHTRWAMSYLRGPLTRQQIQILMQKQRQELLAQVGQPTGRYTQPLMAPSGMPGMAVAPPASLPGQTGFRAQAAPPPGLPGSATVPSAPVNIPLPPMPGATQPSAAVSAGGIPAGFTDKLPPISGSMPQYFLPSRLTSQQAVGQWEQQTGAQARGFGGATLVYEPVLLAQSVVRYQDRKASVYTARVFAYHVPDLQRAGLIHWEDYFAEPVDAREVATQPFGQSLFGDLPPGLTDAERMTALKREIMDMLYNTALLTVPFNPTLKVYGNPDTEFSEFQATIYQLAREQRDAEMDTTSAKYDETLQKLEQRYKLKEQELRSEKQESGDRRREELYTKGEAIYSLFKGRPNYTLSRMSRAGRYRRQTKNAMEESYLVLDDLEQKMGQLETEYEQVLKEINDRWSKVATEAQEYVVSPLKKDIQLELFGIGWRPAWYAIVNGQAVLLNAF